MINLMIVEDNEVVRFGLVTFLNEEADLNIAAEAVDGSGAIAQMQSGTKIDIALVDWNMPDMNGLELTRFLIANFPELKVIVLTMHGKQDYKDKARAAGAKGYILKDGEFEDLVDAIKRVALGEEIFA